MRSTTSKEKKLKPRLCSRDENAFYVKGESTLGMNIAHWYLPLLEQEIELVRVHQQPFHLMRSLSHISTALHCQPLHAWNCHQPLPMWSTGVDLVGTQGSGTFLWELNTVDRDISLYSLELQSKL